MDILRSVIDGSAEVGTTDGIRYTDDMSALTADRLRGFFVGWPTAPSPEQHLAVLRGSYRAVVAIDEATDEIVGFITMISDGVLTAFIPWLEVLPSTSPAASAASSSRASSPAPSTSTPSTCSATRRCRRTTSASAWPPSPA